MIIFINSKFLTKRLRLIFLIVKKYSYIVIISQKGIVYYVRNERNNSLPTVQTNSNIPLDEESIEDNSKSDFEENLSSSSFSIQYVLFFLNYIQHWYMKKERRMIHIRFII